MALLRRGLRRGPALASTGHEGDDKLLAQINRRSTLSEPRHWVHYLYCPDEIDARAAAARLETLGWQIGRLESLDAGWIIAAEEHDAVLTPERVHEARRQLEQVAAGITGGEYDGWKASL